MSLTGSRFSSESAPGPLYGAFLVKKFKQGGASHRRKRGPESFQEDCILTRLNLGQTVAQLHIRRGCAFLQTQHEPYVHTDYQASLTISSGFSVASRPNLIIRCFLSVQRYVPVNHETQYNIVISIAYDDFFNGFCFGLAKWLSTAFEIQNMPLLCRTVHRHHRPSSNSNQAGPSCGASAIGRVAAASTSVS
jgi:hypothetical protein